MRKGNLGHQLRKNGFSLVELMIVLVIIGILMAILIPNMLDATHRAKQRATVGELRAWGNALGAYVAEIGTFPAGTGAPGVLVSTIHNQLVPYAVSALHDQDSWKFDMRYVAPPLPTPTSYTVISYAKNGILDVCLTPATWFNYNEDIAISDGLFVCSPS
ncbi:type II secretion system GspH family protein [bacterium]|nr:type II secretion system GspH family protein [bacterium]MCI0604720.1 type II secretion system GspH family protein [bacterium]